MAIHRVSESEGNWTQKLADVLETATDGDVVVVSSYEMLDLAKNALKRRTDGKYVRVMREGTYIEIEGVGALELKMLEEKSMGIFTIIGPKQPEIMFQPPGDALGEKSEEG